VFELILTTICAENKI